MKWIPIITNENDWIFISFIAILGIIAFIKTYHSFRFKMFSKHQYQSYYFQ